MIRSLDRYLNLGRNLAETLTRHSLVWELTYNLTKMVQRFGSSAFPRHYIMSEIPQNISIAPPKPDQLMNLSNVQASHLLHYSVIRISGTDLRTSVMEETVEHGVFLKYNPTSKTFDESKIHKALQQTIEDIRDIRRLDSLPYRHEWDQNLLRDVKIRTAQNLGQAVQVKVIDVVYAISHYNRTENLYNEHVALCKVLLNADEDTVLETYQRLPVTPFGKEEEKRIRAERVSTAEIIHLIQNSIHPFGTRPPRDLFGKTPEEQVHEIAKSISPIVSDTLKKFNLEAELNPELFNNITREIAQEFLDKHTASPEEGIEYLHTK